MNSPFSKVKGFKQDKRNLIESTNNLVVFGKGQTGKESVNSRGRRLGGGPPPQCLRSRSRAPAPQPPPPKSMIVGPPRPLPLPLPPPPEFRISSASETTATKNSSGRVMAEMTSSGNNNFVNFHYAPTGQKLIQDTKTVSMSTTPVPYSYGQLSGDLPILLTQQRVADIKLRADLTCPLCSRGFEPLKFTPLPISDAMRHGFIAYQQGGSLGRRNLEDGWGTQPKPKPKVPQADVVVVAACGELFHKACFRDWASQAHKGCKRASPRSGRALSCPSCGKEVKFMTCHEIDVVSTLSNLATPFDRDFANVRHMHKELQVLWPEASSNFSRLRQEIFQAKTVYGEIRSRRRTLKSELRKLTPEDLSTVMAKITDVNSLRAGIEKQGKALEFMKQETLQIMRMYLITVLRKLKAAVPSGDFSLLNVTLENGNPPDASRIPGVLLPYLQDILNDNHSLSLLSQIIVPPKESSEARQKMLELKILEKFDPTKAIALSRTHTYTVLNAEGYRGGTRASDIFGSDLSEWKASNTSSALNPNVVPLGKANPASENSVIAEKPPQLREVKQLPTPSPMVAPSIPVNPMSEDDVRSISTSQIHSPVPPSSLSSLRRRSFHSSLEVVAVSEPDLSQTSFETRATTETHQQQFSNSQTPVTLFTSAPLPNPPQQASTMPSKQQIRTEASQRSQLQQILTPKQPPSTETHSSPIITNSSGQLPPGDNKPPKIHQAATHTPPECTSGRSWSTVSDDEDNEGEHLPSNAAPPQIQPPALANPSHEAVNVIHDHVSQDADLECDSSTCPVFFSNHDDTFETDSRKTVSIYQEDSVSNQSQRSWSDENKNHESKPVKASSDETPRVVGFFTRPVHSDTVLANLPPGQVSIAIMYIIDSDDENVVGESKSENSDQGGDKEDDGEKESSKDTLLPPVYVTAEKTSVYSIIANQRSVSNSTYSLEGSELREQLETLPPLPAALPYPQSNESCGNTNSLEFDNLTAVPPPASQESEMTLSRSGFGSGPLFTSPPVPFGNPPRLPRNEPMEVTVFYENEKAITRSSAKIGRRLATK